MSTPRRWPAPSHPLQLILGLSLWSLWFVVLYGGLSVACEMAPPEPSRGVFTAHNATLGLLSLATLGLLLWLAWSCLSASRRQEGVACYLSMVSAGLHLFSGGGVVVVGLPLLMLPPCL
ncbi:hypothetical protein [Halomonas urumqiensis]|uniref:Uncharacterized protein n=1 Tax=Halomonas urumqiensis TaxID=1684789 RepID=A0A2N7UFI8_9GAMM|nr:hypothetical protein [Halomonas urumqiensis]PMR79228.1 hypothetical protein C1H70_13105 [Halomonas urumqiensis]PTB03902.1 hypothetical protein C6V82_05390 [Halomonas urumqiensis]GHE19854.1 hypothetical protein GCM10017767_03750 [Halomonas urumqiensis]